MQLLLDTNVLIALADNYQKIGSKTQQLLENRDNDLSMSYFSLMEMHIKNRLGKLPIEPNFIRKLQDSGIELLYPTLKELESYQIRDEYNKDPFDNYIVAHTTTTKRLLVTFDKKLLKLQNLKSIDARL